MGHEISAYVGTITPSDLESVATTEERGDQEIAYLPGRYGLYEALDATFYDGKVSGIGLGRWFTCEQLRSDGWSHNRRSGYLERLPPDRNVCYFHFG